MAQHCTARARWGAIVTWPIRAFWRWCIKLACVRHSLIYRFRPGTDEASPDRNVRCVRHGHNAQPMHGLITHHAKRWLGHGQHSRSRTSWNFIAPITESSCEVHHTRRFNGTTTPALAAGVRDVIGQTPPLAHGMGRLFRPPTKNI